MDARRGAHGMDVTGKVVAVTGGGNGIGREVVLALLRRGAWVAAIDLDEVALPATAGLAGPSERLSLHPVDITDRDAVLALRPRSSAASGRSTRWSTSPASSTPSSRSPTSGSPHSSA